MAVSARLLEQQSLMALPLVTFNLMMPQAETLLLWGCKRWVNYLRCQKVELVVRLGRDGKRLRALARGEYPHLMGAEKTVFTPEQDVASDAPVEMLDSLLFVVWPMLYQPLARAQNRCYALASMT